MKLVIKHNRYFVETTQADILQMLLNDSVIGPLRIDSDHQVQPPEDVLQQQLQQTAGKPATNVNPNDVEAVFSAVIGGDNEREEEDDDIDTVHSFEIANESVEVVKKRCQEIDYPVLEEYDFRNDHRNPDLDIDLKPSRASKKMRGRETRRRFPCNASVLGRT